MATLIRRNDYATVPGMVQNTGLGPVSSNLTTTAFRPSSYLFGEASIDFFPVSPLTDYNTFKQQYDFDTGAFGMLASLYGPNVRKAMSMSVYDIYGDRQAANVNSFGFGVNPKGITGSINVSIDPDLGTRQADPESVAWYRKIGQDQIPTDPVAFAIGLNLVNPNGKFYKENERTITNFNRSLQGLDPLPAQWVSKFDKTYTSPLRAGAVSTQSIHNANYGDVQSKPVSYGFTPNQNLFGGHGVKVYRDNERLSYGGIISGPSYHIGKPVKSTYMSPSSYLSPSFSWR